MAAISRVFRAVGGTNKRGIGTERVSRMLAWMEWMGKRRLEKKRRDYSVVPKRLREDSGLCDESAVF